MNDYIIPTFNDINKKVIGINVANLEIPFTREITFKEFIDNYYDHIRITFEIIDLLKASGELRSEWNHEELKEFVQESNDLQLVVLNTLSMNKTLTREEILKVIRQVDNNNKHFSARQLGPQIGGIRSRVKNLKKEELIRVDSKNQSYSLNESYREIIKGLLNDALKEL